MYCPLDCGNRKMQRPKKLTVAEKRLTEKVLGITIRLDYLSLPERLECERPFCNGF